MHAIILHEATSSVIISEPRQWYVAVPTVTSIEEEEDVVHWEVRWLHNRYCWSGPHFFLTRMSWVFSSVSVPSPTIIVLTSFAVGVLYLHESLLRRVTKRSDKGGYTDDVECSHIVVHMD